MTYPDERVRADSAHIARCLWRADLLDYTAAGLASFGDQTGAAAKTAEAELQRLEAANAQALLDARVSEDVAAVRAASDACRAGRSYWRQIKEMVGPDGIQTINNFSEPSDDELVGGAS